MCLYLHYPGSQVLCKETVALCLCYVAGEEQYY